MKKFDDMGTPESEDDVDYSIFKERTDIVDGWQLSNLDLIAAGLGRLPGFVDN